MQTALAPMHSALTTSEPRRNPLSTMIGMRPFTASTISGSASMVERPESSLRAVVGHDDRVDAVVGGDDGVLPGEDALDYDLHLGGVAQPLEEVPGHGRRLGVGKPGKIDALIHRAGSHARLQARAVVTAAAVARVGGAQAEE